MKCRYGLDDTLLDLRIRENGFYRLGKACQAVYACDQDIFYATVLQSVQNGKPELCTLILPYIHAEHVFMPFHIDSDSDINRTFYNPAFITDMVMDGVHENDRIDFLQRPFLPFFYDVILSRLVDTFFSRILYPMLPLSGNHSIAVV